jgi:pimeloyl-ACP methyl ester carboxylesterase
MTPNMQARFVPDRVTLLPGGAAPRGASAAPLTSALKVVLNTLAGTRRHRGASTLEALRRRMFVGAPLGADVSHLVAGDRSAPRIVLVHGTPGSALGWADYLLDPPPGIELVALDRPGFGRSGPRHAVTTLDAQAAAVAALLPDDGRRCVLLGHSLGGALVARVAAQFADRVHGVVLLAAALDPALESIHPLQRAGSRAPLRWLLPRAIRNANAELIALRAELEALRAWLPCIEAPVLIVHGTHDDLVPVANVAYLQARLTGARCVQTLLLERRNHFLPWNASATVRSAMRRACELAC